MNKDCDICGATEDSVGVEFEVVNNDGLETVVCPICERFVK